MSKQSMIPEDETITLTIKAKASVVPGRTQNWLHLAEAGCFAKISQEDEHLGDVGGTFGAGYEIKDVKTGYTWFITPEEFWRAYLDAI